MRLPLLGISVFVTMILLQADSWGTAKIEVPGLAFL
jgi:hypothetical protein